MALKVKNSLVWSRGLQHKIFSLKGFAKEEEKFY